MNTDRIIADDGRTIFDRQINYDDRLLCHSFYGRRMFSPNKDEVFLSVLVPYDQERHTPQEISQATKTELGKDGVCKATVFGKLLVTIKDDGTWSVERKGDITKELKMNFTF